MHCASGGPCFASAAPYCRFARPARGFTKSPIPSPNSLTKAAFARLLTLFCRHTSASLLIQENAAPAARRDLERYFERIAPEAAGYEHDDEGPDDMPSHLRSALTATQLSIPVKEGALVLGTWQGIFLFEHRRHPHEREIALHLIGE